MKKAAIFLMLLIALISAGCGKKTKIPETTAAVQVATLTPTITITQTPTSSTSGPIARTQAAGGKGYSLEFSREISSGLAVISASARACGDLRGPWEGSFELVLDAGEMVIQGSGPFNFAVPPGEYFVSAEAPFSGGGDVSSTSCVILDVSDSLRFEITIHPENLTADVLMGSYGAGTFTAQCRDFPPQTIPFAVAWGPDPLTVPIIPLDSCP